jgi:hypothetical protein
VRTEQCSSGSRKRENVFTTSKKQRITVLDRVWFRELNKQDSSSKGSTKNRGGKRGRSSKEVDEEEEPKGYIHVRARRGQATDSHSLAERVHTTILVCSIACVFSPTAILLLTSWLFGPQPFCSSSVLLPFPSGEEGEDQREDEGAAGPGPWL